MQALGEKKEIISRGKCRVFTPSCRRLFRCKVKLGMSLTCSILVSHMPPLLMSFKRKLPRSFLFFWDKQIQSVHSCTLVFLFCMLPVLPSIGQQESKELENQSSLCQKHTESQEDSPSLVDITSLPLDDSQSDNEPEPKHSPVLDKPFDTVFAQASISPEPSSDNEAIGEQEVVLEQSPSPERPPSPPPPLPPPENPPGDQKPSQVGEDASSASTVGEPSLSDVIFSALQEQKVNSANIEATVTQTISAKPPLPPKPKGIKIPGFVTDGTLLYTVEDSHSSTGSLSPSHQEQENILEIGHEAMLRKEVSNVEKIQAGLEQDRCANMINKKEGGQPPVLSSRAELSSPENGSPTTLPPPPPPPLQEDLDDENENASSLPLPPPYELAALDSKASDPINNNSEKSEADRNPVESDLAAAAAIAVAAAVTVATTAEDDDNSNPNEHPG